VPTRWTQRAFLLRGSKNWTVPLPNSVDAKLRTSIVLQDIDRDRFGSFSEAALRQLPIPNSPGASLFFFATRDELRTNGPLAHTWYDGNGTRIQLN